MPSSWRKGKRLALTCRHFRLPEDPTALGDASRPKTLLQRGGYVLRNHQTRWMFGMWVGQLAATAAIVAAMFRIYAP